MFEDFGLWTRRLCSVVCDILPGFVRGLMCMIAVSIRREKRAKL
uniref:Uncharacterized protein n=1 Tax=Anopheles dirus TaxID=7168 RepID=A0A182NX29_9DIPT